MTGGARFRLGVLSALCLLSTPALAAPRLAIAPERFDFGRVLQERTLEKPFQLRNLGDEDVVIREVASDCGCTAALLDEKERTLAPGASATLLVKFSTRKIDGPVKRKVIVTSNDPEHPSLTISLEAVVVPESKGKPQ